MGWQGEQGRGLWEEAGSGFLAKSPLWRVGRGQVSDPPRIGQNGFRLCGRAGRARFPIRRG